MAVFDIMSVGQLFTSTSYPSSYLGFFHRKCRLKGAQINNNAHVSVEKKEKTFLLIVEASKAKYMATGG